MKVIIGPKISLSTKHGDFDVSHVQVNLQSKLLREGVLLEKQPQDENEIYVRIQSSCLFSESFWTTNCDCALQLQKSMQLINEKGGYVLYFYEEGRGAGLNTKFKAIQLQQLENMDTRTAYECLNLKVDERSYEAAAAVLIEVLKDKPVVLLTNNEGKVNGLKDNGVNIIRREPLLEGMDQPEIKSYLEEKRDTLGHIIS